MSRGDQDPNHPFSGGQPDLGMVMSQGEFDDPSIIAMANNNSFNLGQMGPRGFNPNHLMVPGQG